MSQIHRRVFVFFALCFLFAGAGVWAQNPNVQVWDTKTNTMVNGTDNLGQGFLGGINQRVFYVVDVATYDVQINDCVITGSAGFTLSGMPGSGQLITIQPGLHTPFEIDLTSSTAGTYIANVQCYGTGGFGFQVVWQLLNSAATLTLAAGNTPIANHGQFTFPNTVAGTTSPQVFTITNLGATTLNISNPAVAGTGFSLASGPITSITAGTSTSFTVNFTPPAASSYAGSFTISSNDSKGNTSFIVSLVGTGTAAPVPQIQVKDSSTGQVVAPGATFNLGNATPGVQLTHLFQIVNNGTAPLTLTNPTSFISGAGYSWTGSEPSTPISGNGGTTNFTVAFLASAAGTYPGSVSLTSNASPSPYAFSLSATIPSSGPNFTVRGPGNVVLANGGSYDAGGVRIGTPDLLTFAITNNSTTSNLNLSSVTVTSSSGFSLYTSSYGSMSPGQTVDEVVEFNPTSTAAASGTLSFNAGGVIFTVNLTGHGLTPPPPAPNMVLTWNYDGSRITNGNTYNFLSTTPGTPVSEVFDAANTGTAALNISSVTVTSNPAGCFILLYPPSSPIQPNAPAGLGRIRLTSDTAQSCSATVTIISNDPTYPTFTFYLAGTVASVPFSLSVVAGDGTSISHGGSYSGFSATTVNVPTSRGFTITNNGTAPITITNPTSILNSAAGFSVSSQPPSTAIPGSGGTGTFRIRLLAGSTGTYTGTVTILGDPAGPYTFTISGIVH
jgi:hypothetical protein